MPDVRYVCMSDLHLGEEDSLLTNLKTASSETDPVDPSPVMIHLVESLKELLAHNEQADRKPTLILNGDIPELALTTMNEAAMVWERFIQLTMPEGDELFDRRIIYIPGNHDHHLWETARETQYLNYIEGIPAGEPLDIPWHATNMFAPDPVPAHFMTRVAQRQNEAVEVQTAYPNYALLSEDQQKCVIFHHGHLIESIYRLMSTLKTLFFPDREEPRYPWDIEAENFAWIDFFWSTMGRSGEVGQDVERIYEKLHDPRHLKRLLSNLVEGLDERYDLPGWDRLTAGVTRRLLHMAVDRASGLERHRTDRPLSEASEKGLWNYLQGPLWAQILTELCSDAFSESSRPLGSLLLELEDHMPSDVTFVFGHTHKPFQEDMNFRGYPRWVNVYNSGGWVVDTVDPQSLHGGAIILVDEELNTVSLRMYNEARQPEEYAVRAAHATHVGENENLFYQRIVPLVRPDRDPWKSFSEIVARAIRVRAQNLRARLNTT